MHQAPYPTYCGPQALAALTDLRPNEAAAVLRTVATSFGRPEPTSSTGHLDILRALMALGHPLQMYGPDGSLFAGPGKLRDQFMAPSPPPEDLPADVRAAVLAERRRMVEHNSTNVENPEPARPLILAAWLRKFPRGKWLIIVEDHALAAHDGTIVAGGLNDFGNPVKFGTKLLPRRSQAEQIRLDRAIREFNARRTTPNPREG